MFSSLMIAFMVASASRQRRRRVSLESSLPAAEGIGRRLLQGGLWNIRSHDDHVAFVQTLRHFGEHPVTDAEFDLDWFELNAHSTARFIGRKRIDGAAHRPITACPKPTAPAPAKTARRAAASKPLAHFLAHLRAFRLV